MLRRAIVDASREADVVVGAGDFATKGIGLRDTIDLLRAVVVPTVLVAGNHDDLDELRGACRDGEASMFFMVKPRPLRGFRSSAWDLENSCGDEGGALESKDERARSRKTVACLPARCDPRHAFSATRRC